MSNVYGDRVLRKRKVNARLKKQLGEVVTTNDDLFVRKGIGGKEEEHLDAEYAELTRRLMMADRYEERIMTGREERPQPPAKPQPKPKPDNSDILMISPEQQEEFIRRGGM